MNELCHNFLLRVIALICLEKATMFGQQPRIDSQTGDSSETIEDQETSLQHDEVAALF